MLNRTWGEDRLSFFRRKFRHTDVELDCLGILPTTVITDFTHAYENL